MRKSTTSFLFPDLNVWLALSYQAHIHHKVASTWLDGLPDSARVYFCRITQIGLLRLLSTEAVMKSEVLTQSQAWQVYDRWLEDERIAFVDEPANLEANFRSESSSRRAAAKDWADSYLIAFAESAGFQLVTFDRALHQKAGGGILLLS
jgi:uncharacterized protein